MNPPNVLISEISATPAGGSAIASMVVAIPEHVVSRAFSDETLVLNMEAGLYHSLNATGGRILEVLAECGVVQDAIDRLIAEYDRSPDRLAEEICDFCAQLSELGLLELDPSA
jgi:hypothetical protein